MYQRRLEGHKRRCKGRPTVHEDPNEESKDEAYDQQSAVADLPSQVAKPMDKPLVPVFKVDRQDPAPVQGPQQPPVQEPKPVTSMFTFGNEMIEKIGAGFD